MKVELFLRLTLGTLILCTARVGFAQQQPVSGQQSAAVTNQQRTADWQRFIPNTLSDQKHTFVKFPSDLMHGKHWLPVLGVAGVTSALVIADQFDAGYFRRTTSFNGFNSAFSSTATAAGILATPAVFYSFGQFSRDDYAKQTGLFAAESALDGEIVDLLLKTGGDRQRPSALPPQANFADTFEHPRNRFNGSFPSAHTVAAFSVATVIARRYGRRQKWVPIVAYGLATAVGFSRISASAHFPSDVFLGAAVGYSIGRFVVLRE